MIRSKGVLTYVLLCWQTCFHLKVVAFTSLLSLRCNGESNSKTKQNKTKQNNKQTIVKGFQFHPFCILTLFICIRFMVKLPESHVVRDQSHVARYHHEFRQQDSGFGQHHFEWNALWVTWLVTPVGWFLIVLLHNNQWNRIMLSQLVYHYYANKTVISVIHSIVLGYCISINVLMNFHLSTSLSMISLPLINNLEFKCRIRCCIIVKRVKVLVISMYIAKRWRSWHWHKDTCVSLQRCYRNGFKTIWGC